MKGNIWGNHANLAIDVVTMLGVFGCVWGAAKKHGLKKTKPVVRVWIIVVMTFCAALIGMLSSAGSIYRPEGNGLREMRFWWIGGIMWLIGVVMFAVGIKYV